MLLLPRETAYQNDANYYIGGAASLAAGTGYRAELYLNLPAISQYPPLQSAWLALFWGFGGGFPNNTPWLMLAMEIVALAALALLALCLRREGIPLWFGGLVVVLLGTSAVWFDLTALLFSDVTFTLLGYVLIWLAGLNPAESARHTLWWFGLGLMLGLLLLTRSAGIAPIAGVGLLWLINRDARRFSSAVALLVPLGAALLVKKWAAGDGGTYGDYFGARILELGGWLNYAKFVVGNAWDYASGRCWVEALFNVPSKIDLARAMKGKPPGQILHVAAVMLGLAVTALASFGAWRQRSRSLTRAALVVLAAYAALLVIWPFRLGTRTVLVALPLVLVWLWHGLEGLPLTPRRKRWTTGALAAFLVLNVAGNLELTRRESRRLVTEGAKELADLRALADWLRSTTAPGALISASRDIPANHLRHYLGRRLLANPTPELMPGSFYDVPPVIQGNRTADFAVVRAGGSLNTGHHVLKVERRFGEFLVCRIGQP